MKILSSLLLVFLILVSFILFALLQCGKGDDNGKPGCPNSPYNDSGQGLGELGIEITVPINSNAIIEPLGYGTPKWFSAKAALQYKDLFENDFTLATATAQRVIVYIPIHPRLNADTLRIGDFGIGNLIFSGPPNTTSYNKRLNGDNRSTFQVDETAFVTQRNNFKTNMSSMNVNLET